MSRILSWKSPKEGPIGGDILQFQPAALAASRSAREERRTARLERRAARLAVLGDPEHGLPPRPSAGENPRDAVAQQRSAKLRQGEALAQQIRAGRPKTAKARSWDAVAPSADATATPVPGRSEQIEAIKERNAELKRSISAAAKRWERAPRALGPRPRAFAAAKTGQWRRPASAPGPRRSNLEGDGSIRNEYESEIDPEDLPDIDIDEAELGADSALGAVVVEGEVLSRQPSAEKFLQMRQQEEMASAENSRLQEELAGRVAAAEEGRPSSARRPGAVDGDARAIATISRTYSSAGPASSASAYHREDLQRAGSAPSYGDASTLEYLQQVDAEGSRWQTTGADPTLVELSPEGSDSFSTRWSLSATKSVDPASESYALPVSDSPSAQLFRNRADSPTSDAEEAPLGGAVSFKDGIDTLRIREYGMRDVMAKSVAAAVASNSATQVQSDCPLLLDLRSNLIGDEGAIALVAAVETNPRVTALDLGHNFVKKAGAVALARSLPHTKLRRLDLSHNPLGHEGAKAIGHALGLTGSAGLRSLKLAHVGMGAAGAMAVADGLAANKGLRVLSLASNNLRTSGAMRVAENVGYNTAAGDGAGLTALDLGWCGIDDTSAHKLAQGLHEAAESAKGCSLRRLDLSHNKLGKDGAGELAKMMRRHLGLQLLILDNNPNIAFDGCKKFVSLQLDEIISDVVFSLVKPDDSAKERGKRVVHVSGCSGEQLQAGIVAESNAWERQLFKVGLCGLPENIGLPAAAARTSAAEEALAAARLARQLAANDPLATGDGSQEEDAVEAAEAALAKEEEEAKAAEASASKEAAEAAEAKAKAAEEWDDVLQAERWLAKAEARLDAALMKVDGDAEVGAAEEEVARCREILEKEKREAKKAEEDFQRERQEADEAEAKARREREEAEEAREQLKVQEARARTGAGARQEKAKKKKKKQEVPKQVKRRPRTPKYVLQKATGKISAARRLRTETLEDTVRSLELPLQGGDRCGRSNPPVMGAASADPLDRRRTDGFGRKVHGLHYSDTMLRTDGHLSRSSAVLRRPSGLSVTTAYSKSFRAAKMRRPASAATTASERQQLRSTLLSRASNSVGSGNLGSYDVDDIAKVEAGLSYVRETVMPLRSVDTFVSGHTSATLGEDTRTAESS